MSIVSIRLQTGLAFAFCRYFFCRSKAHSATSAKLAALRQLRL